MGNYWRGGLLADKELVVHLLGQRWIRSHVTEEQQLRSGHCSYICGSGYEGGETLIYRIGDQEEEGGRKRKKGREEEERRRNYNLGARLRGVGERRIKVHLVFLTM